MPFLILQYRKTKVREVEKALKGFYSNWSSKPFLNPMYTFQLLLTVPGLLLLLNSWLALLTVIPVFIEFKVFAKEEEKYLAEEFGIFVFKQT